MASCWCSFSLQRNRHTCTLKAEIFVILLRSFILQQRYPQNIQMYPISYQIVEIMSSVALVHMLNLCSVYRDYVCLLLFWWWTVKQKATKNSFWSCLLASTGGAGYPPCAACYGNFLTFEVSDFRCGILSTAVYSRIHFVSLSRAKN